MHHANSHHAVTNSRYPGMTTYVYELPRVRHARVSNTRVRDARDVTRTRVTRVTGVVICDVKRASVTRDVTRVPVTLEGEPISVCDVKRAERINVYA